MKTLISTDKHILAKVNCWINPFCWFELHDSAFMRTDGLIYMGGFSTQEEAEHWAQRKGMI